MATRQEKDVKIWSMLEMLRRGRAGPETFKALLLALLEDDEKFRDEVIATLGLGLVNNELRTTRRPGV